MADDDFLLNFAAPPAPAATTAFPGSKGGLGKSENATVILPRLPSTKLLGATGTTTKPKSVGSIKTEAAAGNIAKFTDKTVQKQAPQASAAAAARTSAESSVLQDRAQGSADARRGVEKAAKPAATTTDGKRVSKTRTAAVVSLQDTLSALEASRKAIASRPGGATLGLAADLALSSADNNNEAVPAIVRPASDTAALLARTASDFKSLLLDPRLVQKLVAAPASSSSSSSSSSSAGGFSSAAVANSSSSESTNAFLNAATTVRRGHTSEGFGLSRPTRVQRLLVSRYLEASAAHRMLDCEEAHVSGGGSGKDKDKDTNVGPEALMTGVPGVMPPSAFVVRSETGSGKTLAFLLPVLHDLLRAIEGGEFASTSVSSGPRTESKKSRGGDAGDGSDDDEEGGSSDADDAEKAPRRRLLSREAGTLLLILAPTRELCAQIYGVASRLLQAFPYVIPSLLTGGEKKKSEKARLRKGVHVLVATPGRLADHLRTTTAFTTSNLRAIVLDEADRLLDMGFASQVKEVFAELGKRIAPEEAKTILPPRPKWFHNNGSSSNYRRWEGDRNSGRGGGYRGQAQRGPGGSSDDDGENSDREKESAPAAASAPVAAEGSSLPASEAESILAKLPVDRGVKLVLTSATISAQLRALISTLLPGELPQAPQPDPKTEPPSAAPASPPFVFATKPSVCFLDAIPTAPRPELILPSKALTSTSVNMLTVATPPGPWALLEKESEAAWSKHAASAAGIAQSKQNAADGERTAVAGETAAAADAEVNAASASGLAGTTLAAPSQLQQVFMLAPLKWRLAALLGIVYDSIRTWGKANAAALASGAGSSGGSSGSSLALGPSLSRRGSKIILFVSTTHSADFHFVVFKHFLGWMLKRKAAAAPASGSGPATSSSSSSSSSSSPSSFPVFRLHGNIDQSERVRTYRSFAAAGSGLLVATDVAARGLDLPAVDLIVQADAPSDTSDYVHRIGRTARRGQSGHAILLLQPHEAAYAEVLTSAGMMLQPSSTAPVLASMAKANAPAAAEAILAMPRPIDHDYERRKAAERAGAADAAAAASDAAPKGGVDESIGALWQSLGPKAGAMMGAPRAPMQMKTAGAKRVGGEEAAVARQTRDAAAQAEVRINRLMQAAGFAPSDRDGDKGRGGKKGGKGGPASGAGGDSGLGLADGVGAGSRTAEMQAALWQSLLEEAVWRLPLPKELHGTATSAADESSADGKPAVAADPREGDRKPHLRGAAPHGSKGKDGKDGKKGGKSGEEDVEVLRHLARLAFMSFVRGYATHERGVRHIFHPRALHLGHAAKAFGLTEAPTMVSTKTKKAAEEEKSREEKAAAAAAREAADSDSEEEGGHRGHKRDHRNDRHDRRDSKKPGAGHGHGQSGRSSSRPFDKHSSPGKQLSGQKRSRDDRSGAAGGGSSSSYPNSHSGGGGAGAGAAAGRPVKKARVTEYDA